MAQSNKKTDRTNLIVASCIASCASFAYGFSNQSALFQWWIPVVIPILAAAWAFRPRSAGQRESNESA